MEKGAKVNQILKETLGIQAPVVWIENDTLGHVSYTLYVIIQILNAWYNTIYSQDLDHINDWTLLPDMTPQPRNLYQTIADLFKDNNDRLGLLILNAFFADKNENVRMSIGMQCQSKVARQEALNDKERELLDIFLNDSVGDPYLPEVMVKFGNFSKENALDKVIWISIIKNEILIKFI